MKYALYQVEEFLTDPDFIRWCSHPDTKSDAFWREFLQLHPERESTIRQARAILRALQFDDEKVSETTVDAEWSRFTRERTQEIENETVPVIALRPTRNWWWVAATIAGLLVGLFWWNNQHPADTIYRTTFGQVRTIKLPDGSRLTMNANTEVRFPGNWSAHEAREVWLKGEAFFRVVKRAGQSQTRFIVHTEEAQVEVLGTAFNVHSRHHEADVLLQTGSVRLFLTGADTVRSLLMRPGDGVHFRPKTGQIDHRLVSPDRMANWTEGVLLLDHMTLQQLSQIIEDTYGRRVVIQSKALASRVLSGSLPTRNEQAFLEGIAITLNVPMHQENNQIVFGP
ncbi:FecR family protein [Spirosoma areae]